MLRSLWTDRSTDLISVGLSVLPVEIIDRLKCLCVSHVTKSQNDETADQF